VLEIYLVLGAWDFGFLELAAFTFSLIGGFDPNLNGS
jgi:hypothetical protein